MDQKKRNIMIASLGATLAFRTYLFIRSEAMYNKYSNSIEEAENRHEKIESLDNQKPFVDIFSGIIIFPIVYYHAKYLEMDRWTGSLQHPSSCHILSNMKT